MDDLISIDEISKVTHLKGFGSEILVKMIMQIFKINDINTIYKDIHEQSTEEFLQSVIDRLELKFEIEYDSLARIPAKDSFITISNHPFGGLEGIILIHLLLAKRPDYKVMANYILHKFEPLKEKIIAVNPFEDIKSRSSFSGIKECKLHLEAGNSLGLFPAGEVATFDINKGTIMDREWQPVSMKMIKKANVPVVPIFFQGSNGFMFQLLSAIHPLLRTARLPIELFNKKNQTLHIRIGYPISVKEQGDFKDLAQYTRYLRARTYALGTKFDVKHYFFPRTKKINRKKPQDLIAPIPVEIIEAELEKIKHDYLLFESGNFIVYLASATEIPEIITEIGRLREVTFREVGEGTNKSIDIDEFDLYYNHLFIWDTQAKAIVGAYRIGKGRDILAQYGRKGFYVNTLFKLKKDFVPILNESLEMGRSFITKEYQRRPNSLFLLWKGILYTLLKNPDYRYMFGPVSISNEFSYFSKSLICEFIRRNHYDEKMSSYIKARKPFKPLFDIKTDAEFILNTVGDDITKLDNVIKDIEHGMVSPVLMKKYLKLNAKIVSFNVDPDFNNCVDGFVIADIFDFPSEVVKAFSKEFNDKTILERFGFNDF